MATNLAQLKFLTQIFGLKGSICAFMCFWFSIILDGVLIAFKIQGSR